MGRAMPVECKGTGIFNSTGPNLKLRLVKHLSLNVRFAPFAASLLLDKVSFRLSNYDLRDRR